MNKSTVLLLAASIGSMTMTNAQKTKKNPVHTTSKTTKSATTNVLSLKNETDSLSYAIGLSMAKFYKTQGIEDLNTTLLQKAIKDGMGQGKPIMTDDEAQMVMMTTAQKMMAKRAAVTRKEGQDFLAKNKLKDSVVALPDGLQYKILKAGTGPKPTANDNVKVHYVGTLLDGTEFDNSISRGAPLDIDVNGVIKGWTEALQLMPVGSKWRLFIPSDLAYGDRQAGQVIKAGSTLIFDVELLGINKKDTTDTTDTTDSTSDKK